MAGTIHVDSEKKDSRHSNAIYDAQNDFLAWLRCAILCSKLSEIGRDRERKQKAPAEAGAKLGLKRALAEKEK